MKIKLLLIASLFTLLSCRPTPFKVQQLSPSYNQIPASTDKRESDFMRAINEGLKARYESKKSPTFALINGYYRLPQTKPFGAALVIRNYSYKTSFETLDVPKQKTDFAVEPLSGDDAIYLNDVINSLLNIGVKIKDITMTDALSLAEAEKNSLLNDQIFKPRTTLPPDVDYLISLYPAVSKNGPVLIGRVIKNDGRLMAFRVMNRNDNKNIIGDMVTSLFEDTINRI